MEDPSVSCFREYLKINTMHPDPVYDKAIEFLRKQAQSMGLEFFVHDTGMKGKPIVRITWKGTKPHLKSILLCSHMDVVPVFPDQWKYEPFSAHKDEQGDIYARGSQDMKCVSIWYLEAIKRLIAQGQTFPRTLHLLFSSDEEIGGAPTGAFVQTKEYQELNGGFGLDEGIANPGQKMKLYYGERSMIWVKIICHGSPGHGSSFIENSAGKKLQYIINRFYDLRDEQEKKWKGNPEKGLGSVISVNMSIVEGGVQPNVVPEKLSAVFDVRVPPTHDTDELHQTFQRWCEEAGKDVELTYIHKTLAPDMVELNDSNPFWMAFKQAADKSGVELQTEIFPAGTDSKYHRAKGVDILGFSPMNNTPQLLHDHNEFLNEDVFLKGIDIYCNIIPALATVE